MAQIIVVSHETVYRRFLQGIEIEALVSRLVAALLHAAQQDEGGVGTACSEESRHEAVVDHALLYVAVMIGVVECKALALLSRLCVEPAQLTRQPLVIVGRVLLGKDGVGGIDGASIVFHAWRAGFCHGFGEVCLCQVVAAQLMLDAADSRLPHGQPQQW